MDTPKRMGPAETLARISGYFSAHCRLEQARQLKCIHCGGEILAVRAHMSLHDERFGETCIGPGRAWRMQIPYCPACENPPSEYGCIHMTEAELSLPSVIEASYPFGRHDPEYRKTPSP